MTYRFRGHSMADPEEYRTKEEVEEWRERDPIATFAKRLVDEGVLTEEDVEELDEEAIETVDEAVEFADESPVPRPRLALRRRLRATASRCPAGGPSTSARPRPHRGEEEREAGELPHELAEAGAAYATWATRGAQRRSDEDDEGEAGADEPEDEGGAD